MVTIHLTDSQIAAIRSLLNDGCECHDHQVLGTVDAAIRRAEEVDRAFDEPQNITDKDIGFPPVRPCAACGSRNGHYVHCHHNTVPDVSGADILPPDYDPRSERARARNAEPWFSQFGRDI